MNATKILAEEIADISVSSLPTRPTSPTPFGGKGYTAEKMKAAFDKLPLFIVERFNALLDDIAREGEGSIAEAIPTGIYDGHTLASLFSDIANGNIGSYLIIWERPLSDLIGDILARLARLEGNE